MQIERVIVNFADTCNMQCPFCYIPFDKKPVNFETLHRIVDRCEELKVRVITFGGGDPFAYQEFRRVLPTVKERGFFVHVDTNGLGVADADINLIKANVDLLSLPLDGSNAQMQDAMRRSYRNNFDKVRRIVEQVADSNVHLKINTVASAVNYEDIPAIAELVSTLPVHRWSLYQFWPNAVPTEYVTEFSLVDSLYDEVVGRVRARLLAINSTVKLEAGRVSDRRSTYVFVKPNDTADTYFADPNDFRRNIYPGSFFEVTAMESFEQLVSGTTLRSSIRDRYMNDSDCQ